jgi:hypothetical protein
MRKKSQMAYWHESDLLAVRGAGHREKLDIADLITVLIPSSPIATHPDTSRIEQTIRDIRANLPDCEIIIMLDGLRPEQEDRRGAYEECKRRLLWLAHHTWHNVLPIIFDEHMHQAAMTREVLNQVATPTIFFVEHDAPITPDHDFDWQTLTDAIMQGDVNIIRFYHEAGVLPEHEYLMLGPVEQIRARPAPGTTSPQDDAMEPAATSGQHGLLPPDDQELLQPQEPDHDRGRYPWGGD